jgi:membrane-associated phospholipid phosphatase
MDAIGPPQTKKFAAMPYKPQAARNLSKPPDDSERFLPPAGWLGDAGSRIANRWVIKMAGTTAIMTAFFAVYFYLLNHSRLPVTTVPRIFVDRMIAFRPGALPLYVSLWVYVPLAPALFRYTSEMRAYTVAVLVLSAIGFGIFILWPTTIPKPEFDQAPVPSLAYLKAVDASGNAFPSLHVAFAVFTVFLFDRLLREMRSGFLLRALNVLWCAGIIYSTIAIRQHVALDALAGMILGGIGGLVLLRVLRGPAPAGG